MPLEYDDRSLRIIGCNTRGLRFYDSATPPALKAEIYLDADCNLIVGSSTAGAAASNPLTLTVSTTNNVTGSGHTHQVLSSSSPGQSAVLLATDSNGDLILRDLTLRGGDLRNDAGTLTITPTVTVASAAGAVGDAIKFNADTLTITGTTAITTAPFAAYTFAQPTFDFSSTATMSHGATVYIANAPADPDVAISEAYALFIGAGQSYMANCLVLGQSLDDWIEPVATQGLLSGQRRLTDITPAVAPFGSDIILTYTGAGSKAPIGHHFRLETRLGANDNAGVVQGVRIAYLNATTGVTKGNQTGDAKALYVLSTNSLPDLPTATTTTLIGVEADAVNDGTGTTTNAIGVRALARQDGGAGGGAITSAYALYADVQRSAGSLAITTGYGLYVDTLFGTTTYGVYIADQTGGTNYGLYIVNATTLALWVDDGITRLDGDLAVGVGANPSARLHVLEDTAGAEVLRLETVATNDDPTYRVLQARVATTDATATTLQTIAITASNTYLIETRVLARRTGGAGGTAEDGAGYVVRGTYKTVAGTVTLIGAILADYTAEDQVLWDATLVISGTNVIVQVTGAALNNVTWHATTVVSLVGT